MPFDAGSIRDLTDILEFLAASDQATMPERCDVVVLLGNAVLSSLDLVMEVMETGRAERLVICGGIGHSTEFLMAAAGVTEVRPEAEILANLLEERGFRGSPLLETASTNCGSNAVECRRMLQAHNLTPQDVILVQDPTMQRRSHASFRRVWRGEPVRFWNAPAPVPAMGEGPMPWTYDRLLELVLGEIPRFDAYGPKGRDFIEAVEVPETLRVAHQRLLEANPQLLRKLPP